MKGKLKRRFLNSWPGTPGVWECTKDRSYFKVLVAQRYSELGCSRSDCVCCNFLIAVFGIFFFPLFFLFVSCFVKKQEKKRMSVLHKELQKRMIHIFLLQFSPRNKSLYPGMVARERESVLMYDYVSCEHLLKAIPSVIYQGNSF